MSNIVYVGTFVDVLGRDLGIYDKKVGITGGGKSDIFSRANQLSNTKSPIKWIPLRAWEFKGNVKHLEKALHAAFADQHTEGEWFSDDKHNVVSGTAAIMESLRIFGVKVQEIDLDGVIAEDNTTETKRIRRKVDTSHRITLTYPEAVGTKILYHRFGRDIVIEIMDGGKIMNSLTEDIGRSLSSGVPDINRYINRVDVEDEAGRSIAVNVWNMKIDDGRTVDQFCKDLYKKIRRKIK